jgi:hypothetical protein
MVRTKPSPQAVFIEKLGRPWGGPSSTALNVVFLVRGGANEAGHGAVNVVWRTINEGQRTERGFAGKVTVHGPPPWPQWLNGLHHKDIHDCKLEHGTQVDS